MKRTDRIDALAARFVELVWTCVKEQGSTRARGYNIALDGLGGVQEEMVATDRGLAALRGLTAHERPSVRAEAGICLLKLSEPEAMPLLKELLAWGLDERDEKGRRPREASYVYGRVQDELCFRFDVPILDVDTHFLGRAPEI